VCVCVLCVHTHTHTHTHTHKQNNTHSLTHAHSLSLSHTKMIAGDNAGNASMVCCGTCIEVKETYYKGDSYSFTYSRGKKDLVGAKETC
jgi:hypothetical protein